jgi:hypothetical protein
METDTKTVITSENYVDYLINCVKIAQSRGKIEIKEASLLNKVIKVIKKPELAEELGMPELTETTCIATLVRGITISNQRGAYTLEDAEAIDVLFGFLEKNQKGKEVTN